MEGALERDGLSDGAPEGSREGAAERDGASEVDGFVLGVVEGDTLGTVDWLGPAEGSVDGLREGALERLGLLEGITEGVRDGAPDTDGASEIDGTRLGLSEGDALGWEDWEGSVDGTLLGLPERLELNSVDKDGLTEGCCDLSGVSTGRPAGPPRLVVTEGDSEGCALGKRGGLSLGFRVGASVSSKTTVPDGLEEGLFFRASSVVGKVPPLLSAAFEGLAVGLDDGLDDGLLLGEDEGALETEGAPEGDMEGLPEGRVDKDGATVGASGEMTKVGNCVKGGTKVGNDVMVGCDLDLDLLRPVEELLLLDPIFPLPPVDFLEVDPFPVLFEFGPFEADPPEPPLPLPPLPEPGPECLLDRRLCSIPYLGNVEWANIFIFRCRFLLYLFPPEPRILRCTPSCRTSTTSLSVAISSPLSAKAIIPLSLCLPS